MTLQLTRGKVDSDFIARLERLSGQNLLACYQCGKCSAGCPMAEHMDIPPNQMIRLAQLGCEEELLSCEAAWLCVSCMTCNSRCPKGVKIAETMEAIRQIQLRRRQDHMTVRNLPVEALDGIPPIALIGSMRKFTS